MRKIGKISIFAIVFSLTVVCNEKAQAQIDLEFMHMGFNFMDQIEFDSGEPVGFISVNTGGFQVTTDIANPRFYGKLSGGAGLDWIIGGVSLMYYERSLLDTTAVINPEMLFGIGAFIRLDGGEGADIPLSLGYEIGTARGIYHSITLGVGGAVKVTVNFDFFEGAEQPILGAGLSYTWY